jgi:hypothetical protein
MKKHFEIFDAMIDPAREECWLNDVEQGIKSVGDYALNAMGIGLDKDEQAFIFELLHDFIIRYQDLDQYLDIKDSETEYKVLLINYRYGDFCLDRDQITLTKEQKELFERFEAFDQFQNHPSECPTQGDLAPLFNIDLETEESIIESYKKVFPNFGESQDDFKTFYNVTKDGVDLYFPYFGMITFRPDDFLK